MCATEFVCQTTNYCTNVLRADLGKCLTEIILDTWRKKKQDYKKHLTHQDLQVIRPLLSLFFFGSLIRQIKRTSSSLNISDHIQM